MSQLDLSDKGLYDMISPEIINNDIVVEKTTMMEMEKTKPVAEQVVVKPKSFKIERSIKSFVIFILVVSLVAAFIYFTIYRLGWGVKECMNKNYHDCAALLTPEMAPLAATGLLALL
jgi:hypothetical protein